MTGFVSDIQGLRTLDMERRAFYTLAHDPETNRPSQEANKAILDHLGEYQDQFTHLYPKASVRERLTLVMRSIIMDLQAGKASELLTRLPQGAQDKLKELIQARQNAIDISSQMLEGPRVRLSELVKQIKDQYAGWVDRTRLNPNDDPNPHPTNVRIAAAVPQGDFNGMVAPLPNGMNRQVQDFIDHVKQTGSLDAAIDATTQLQYSNDGSNGDWPYISKQVATDRHNPHAWRKADNQDPNVRRIVLQFATDPVVTTMMANTLNTAFHEAPVGQATGPDQYRVDRIVTLETATPEQIEQAFKAARQWADAERQRVYDQALTEARLHGGTEQDHQGAAQAAVANLRFEAFTGWHGHGNVDENKTPEGDRGYQEGAQEFKFKTATDHMSETQIKALERQYLGPDCFDYVVGYSMSCRSGALIA